MTSNRAERIKKARLNGFIKYPKKLSILLFDGYLSSGAFGFYLALLSIAVYSENSENYGAIELSRRKVSKLFKKSASSIYRYSTELVELGLIEVIDDELIAISNFESILGDVSNMENAVSDLITKVANKKGELSHKKS